MGRWDSFIVFSYLRECCRLARRQNPAKVSTDELFQSSSSGCLFALSDFIIFAVAAWLPAQSLARLMRTCTTNSARVGTEQHIASLILERVLPGIAAADKEWAMAISTLRALHRAETPSMEAVLCMFGFASRLPKFDDTTRRTLKEFAALLNRHPLLHVSVEGHSQPGAPEPIASNLALERAELIAKEMHDNYGVDRSRIRIAHHSNRRPRFPDMDRNRRVELSVFEAPVVASGQRRPRSSRMRYLFRAPL